MQRERERENRRKKTDEYRDERTERKKFGEGGRLMEGKRERGEKRECGVEAEGENRETKR